MTAPGRALSPGVIVPDALGASLLALSFLEGRVDSELEVPLPLSPRERAVLATFDAYPLRQAEWLGGRTVAKELLERSFGLAPSRIEVLPAESGAPVLYVDGALHPTLRISLSHTKLYAVAAVGPFAVGVDVADDEDGERLPRIAKRVFSEGEAEECGAHASVERQAAVWAIKEAGLKVRIGGVFSPGARSVRVHSLEPVRVGDPALRVVLFRLQGAAVALAREDS